MTVRATIEDTGIARLVRAPAIVLTLGAATALAGCQPKAPNCSASETKELVLQIAEREMVEAIGQQAAGRIDLSLGAIRTQGHDETVGSYSCAAQLQITGPGGSDTLDIEYLSELTDSGGEFFVTVYGL